MTDPDTFAAYARLADELIDKAGKEELAGAGNTATFLATTATPILWTLQKPWLFKGFMDFVA